MLAGCLEKDFPTDDPIMLQAEATYISNLKYAAEECAKVKE